jgi:fumarylpyruvate hydrolase
MSLFDLPPIPDIPVIGEDQGYPLRRIICVGRNYEAHAKELGNEIDREAPFYFTKSLNALALSGATIPYPPGTDDYHHEMEFAFVMGTPLFRAKRDEAIAAVYGYACALDMTRRDRQNDAKEKRRPWDLAKDVEGSAVVGPITKAADFGPVAGQRITLDVNGARRQDATLDLMIHDIGGILEHLSGYYHLAPGDLILTGTPAGVGAVGPGDILHGEVQGLAPVDLTIGPAE